MNWPRFLRTTLALFAAISAGVYALIILVDPYSVSPLGLPLERAPVSTNQRFAYPALARSERFDSAIIGSSTLRLLKPQNLDKATGASFVNLAMNSATAYEQMRMLDLFVRHHPRAKFIIIGIDDSWCRREYTYQKFTFREFPEWMFDENRWNDLLYLFNDKALENTVRLLELFAGKREPKYSVSGYRDFTKDFGVYDEQAVLRRLYPQGKTMPREIPDIVPARQHPEWQFASHELLAQMLRGVGSNRAQALVLFAPMHGAYLLRTEELYQECKGRVVDIAGGYGVSVMDYMIESSITREDSNYWDPLHYTSSVARQIEADIAQFVIDSKPAFVRFTTY